MDANTHVSPRDLSHLKRHQTRKSHYVPAVSRVKTAGIKEEVNEPIKNGSKFSNKGNIEFRVTKVTLSRLETLETQKRTVGLVVTYDGTADVTVTSPMK